MQPKITKRFALDRFIQERVLGSRGFGLDDTSGFCTYDKAVNGGCEIGQYLLGDAYKYVQNSCTATEVFKGMEEAGLEEPRSEFWLNLQISHDCLARVYKGYGFSELFPQTAWDNFQRALKSAAEFC